MFVKILLLSSIFVSQPLLACCGDIEDDLSGVESKVSHNRYGSSIIPDSDEYSFRSFRGDCTIRASFASANNVHFVQSSAHAPNSGAWSSSRIIVEQIKKKLEWDYQLQWQVKCD
jgi:hypothetical protein